MNTRAPTKSKELGTNNKTLIAVIAEKEDQNTCVSFISCSSVRIARYFTMRKWSLESTSKSRDWERHLCELVDKIVASPSEQYEHMEVLIEDVEDLVISAYLRGIEAGKKKADIA